MWPAHEPAGRPVAGGRHSFVDDDEIPGGGGGGGGDDGDGDGDGDGDQDVAVTTDHADPAADDDHHRHPHRSAPAYVR